MHDWQSNVFLLPLLLNSMSKTQQLCVMNALSHYPILPLYMRPPVTATLPVESGRAVETLTGQRLKSCIMIPNSISKYQMVPTSIFGKGNWTTPHWELEKEATVYRSISHILNFYLLMNIWSHWRTGSQITVSGKQWQSQTNLEVYVSLKTNSAGVKPSSKHKHWIINAPLFYSIGSCFGQTLLKIQYMYLSNPFLLKQISCEDHSEGNLFYIFWLIFKGCYPSPKTLYKLCKWTEKKHHIRSIKSSPNLNSQLSLDLEKCLFLFPICSLLGY